jgi:hypothetical protein
MKFKLTFIFLLFVNFVSCATTTICPSVEEEFVSVCRAERDCGKGTFNHSLGLILGGIGAGMNGVRNEALDIYNRCVDRNIVAQTINGK